MKRSYPANIDGQIFYIDEDAYLMLQDYLQQLHATFRGDEGAEIVSDIESRIRELFCERQADGRTAIVREDVAAVIETMGRPEQISDSEDGEDTPRQPTDELGKEKVEEDVNINFTIPNPKKWKISNNGKKLFRNMQNKVIAGVFGGLSIYLGWNANIMRLCYVLIWLFGFNFISGWPAIILYLIAWMVIPAAVTPRQILEMHGEPVNIENVNQTFIATNNQNNLPAGILKVIGQVLMGIIGFLGGILTLASAICLLAIVFGALVYYFGNADTAIMHSFFRYDGLQALMISVWTMVALLIGISISWASLSAIFNTRGASSMLKKIAIAMLVVLVAFGIVLSVLVASL